MEAYNNIIFDSREEVWFAMWCQELKQAGYIQQWKKVTEPLPILEALELQYTKTIQLKTKKRKENRKFKLLKALEYTPDFEITWTKEGYDKFVSPINNDEIKPDRWFFGDSLIEYIEVKPTFDQHGKTARFSIIQKIIWKVAEVFIDLIIVEALFEGTFMPKEAVPEFKYKKAPRTGQWKVKYKPKTLEEYVTA